MFRISVLTAFTTLFLQTPPLAQAPLGPELSAVDSGRFQRSALSSQVSLPKADSRQPKATGNSHQLERIAGLQARGGTPPAAQPQPPPGTNIHVLVMPRGLDSLKTAVPQALAVEEGYDNQPSFTPDGQVVLFTANRDGKQMDIYEHTRGAGSRPLISTPEGEYSPTITPDGRGVSVIRVEADGTQRLWRFDRDGKNPQVLLAEIKPVGYHAWVDDDVLAIFVLGQPATLRLARLSTGKADIIASEVGRSVQRIPGRRAISFVQREADGRFAVKQLDAETRRVTALTDVVTGSSDRDCAWTPDGTLLMSSGTRIVAWKAGDAGWREVYDVAPHGLGPVTRMAVSPDGTALAIVVSEAAKP